MDKNIGVRAYIYEARVVCDRRYIYEDWVVYNRGCGAVQLLHSNVCFDDGEQALNRGGLPVVRDNGELLDRQEGDVLYVLFEARVQRIQQTRVLVLGQSKFGPDRDVH